MHYMSDIFGLWYWLNIHLLKLAQHCTTLWDYLKGLSPAWQVLRMEQRQRQLQPKDGHNSSKSILKNTVCFLRDKNVRYWEPSEFTKNQPAHTVLIHQISVYYVLKYRQTIWQFVSKFFLSKHVDLYVGIIHHVHNASKFSQCVKVNHYDR